MNKVTPEKFIFNTPLYEVIKWTAEDDSVIEGIVCLDQKIDGPCIHCGKDTTYVRKNPVPRYALSEILSYSRTLSFVMTCSRDNRNEIEIFFKTYPEEYAFLKIGQFPSIASLTKGEIGKYRKILGSPLFSEFSRGVGLISHGVGIGAFVYLRRVFENLIEEAHQLAAKGAGWDEGKYAKGRMDDKIELLNTLLPSFLVKNKVLYGIMSKSIHELDEQECLDIFPVAKLGIEMILDEKIRLKEQEEKVKEAEKLIGNVASKIRGV